MGFRLSRLFYGARNNCSGGHLRREGLERIGRLRPYQRCAEEQWPVFPEEGDFDRGKDSFQRRRGHQWHLAE